MKHVLALSLFLVSSAFAVEYGWSPNGVYSEASNVNASYDNMTEIATPSNPASGADRLYFKSDHNLYKLTSGGVESMLATGSGITALTGDVTATGPGSAVATLATVNSNVGSFGSSTSIPSFTVNGKGLITAASGNVVVAPAGTLSGTTLNSTVVSSSLTSVGTIGTGVWQGTSVAVPYGGTGDASFTAYGVLAGGTTSTGALQSVSPGASGTLFQSGGASALPSWVSSISITNATMAGYTNYAQISTPSAPSSSTDLYSKSDGNFYEEMASGVEQQIQADQVFTLQTTDGASHAIATLALAATTTYVLQATCSARDQAGVDHAAYKLSGVFYNESGTATRQGAADNSAIAESSNANFAVGFSTSSANVVLSVTGNASETVDWNCKIESQSVQ